MSEAAPPQSRLSPRAGSEPFVFVCYSHRDTERVYPHIEYLQQQGVGLWFDGGIRAGAIWRREVTEALDRATHLVFFVSRASLDSDHCDREVQYALDHKKPVLPVFLDDVEFTPELRVALGRVHALYGYKVSREALQGALRHAIQGDGAGTALRPRTPLPASPRGAWPRRTIWLAAAVVVLLGIAAGVWRSGALTGWHIETPAERTGIVVLPFENVSGRDADANLSEGFGDELRDELSRAQGPRVVARTSSVAFRGQNKTAAAIAGELGVAAVVEGSLRKDGDRLRISLRLIDGVSEAQLWSESYDRKASDVLAVQKEIARAASAQILPKVSPTQAPRSDWQPSAPDLMLLARNYQQRAVSTADWDKVVSLYERVIETDPESALAHARLANALFYQRKDVESADKHAQLALSLDPNLSEGHTIYGLLLWSQYRRGVGAEFKRAVELGPNNAEALFQYGQYLERRDDESGMKYLMRARDLEPMSLDYNGALAADYAQAADSENLRAITAVIEERFPDAAGRFALSRIFDTAGDLDEAIGWALEAKRLDPGNDDASNDIAERLARLGLEAESKKVQPEPSLRVLFWERRYDDIIARMANADLDQMDNDSLGTLAFALQATGRDTEALPVLEAMGLPEIALDDDLRRWAALHHLAILIGTLNGVGESEQAQKLAQWLEQRQPGATGWGALWWETCALAALGKRDQALTQFELTAAQPNLAWLPYMIDAGCFRDLRNEPRYQAAIQKLKAQHDVVRDRLPATLAKHGFTMDQI